MKQGFLGLISVVAVLVTVGGGCGKNTYMDESGVQIKGNLHSGEYELTNTQTGESAQVGIQKIPDNFPKDVPIVENRTIIMTSVTPENAALVLTTTLSVQDAAVWYKKEIAKEKWTITSEYNLPSIQTFEAKNDAGDSLAILIGTDEQNAEKKSTTITLTRTKAVVPSEMVAPQEQE